MGTHRKIIRVLAGIIMLASIIFGYWWIVMSLAIIFLFIFPSYYEIILWGVFYDALYGAPDFLGHLFSIASIVVFIIAVFSRKYLIAYV